MVGLLALFSGAVRDVDDRAWLRPCRRGGLPKSLLHVGSTILKRRMLLQSITTGDAEDARSNRIVARRLRDG